ncbi:sulfite exporter TauE/SafE family protein, partial [bacterium]|nr:sulfite exporter TauE/SafE family protein [bacterium]
MEVNAPAEKTPEQGKLGVIALVGLAAGLLSGIFGVGGGILIVPGLVFFAKMDQRRAHGTSLAAVLPISVSSLASYWAHGHVDWPVALFLAIGAV